MPNRKIVVTHPRSETNDICYNHWTKISLATQYFLNKINRKCGHQNKCFSSNHLTINHYFKKHNNNDVNPDVCLAAHLNHQKGWKHTENWVVSWRCIRKFVMSMLYRINSKNGGRKYKKNYSYDFASQFPDIIFLHNAFSQCYEHKQI